MPNRNYLNGVAKERKIVNEARAQGMVAFRSAGSHSPIDAVIIDPIQHIIRLVQCKPKSMSDKSKEKLLDTLNFMDGFYNVKTSVI